MGKVIWGFLKFYLVYMGFGALALIIIYASADLKCLMQSGVSFLRVMIHAPESIEEREAISAVFRFLYIAFDSVPGDTFLDAVLGISFDSNVGSDITSSIIDLFKSGKTASTIVETFRDYRLFWRDMSVATSASMVLYAVAHLKEKIKGKGISVWLGFAFASVWWIFAAYTFAETITFALEKFVDERYLNVLYIIIIITAVGLEALIHAYGGKCSVLKLIALLSLKLFFNLLRSVFVLYMCRCILFFFSGIINPLSMFSNMFGIVISASIVVCMTLVESKVTKWAEKALPKKALPVKA